MIGKIKGKNYSCNNVTGKRHKSDFYETHYSLTQQFLDVWKKDSLIDESDSILEPCCGKGAIVKVLNQNNFYNITSNDINTNGKDFLIEENSYNYCITNPPYNLAFEFIKKAKQIINNEFCFLLPLNYLHGKKRYDEIWMDKKFPLEAVYIFTRYPMLGTFLREDGKYKTGMTVYAWYCFSKNYTGNPQIKWIDNNEYVLNAKDK